MSLKDTWINKTDNVDDVVAEDINSVAQAVISVEDNMVYVEKVANKVTYLEIGGENTHTQYPSAKAVEQLVNAEVSNCVNIYDDTTKILNESSTDGEYPTAKAVVDYVGDKIPLIINIWEDGGNIVSELSDLNNIMFAALIAKRPIIVYEWDSSGMMYILYAYTMTSGELGLYKFSTVKDGNLIELNCSGDGSGAIVWTKTTKDLETTDNKETELSASSTNDKYPSAKAVVDYVGNIETALERIIAEQNSIIAIQNTLIGGESA